MLIYQFALPAFIGGADLQEESVDVLILVEVIVWTEDYDVVIFFKNIQFHANILVLVTHQMDMCFCWAFVNLKE